MWTLVLGGLIWGLFSGYALGQWQDELPPAPANDEPCGAILIPFLTECEPISGTTTGAGNVRIMQSPAIRTDEAADVWYKFVPAKTCWAQVQTLPGEMFDGVIEIFTGSCTEVRPFTYYDDLKTINLMPRSDMFIARGGDTIFIRVLAFPGTPNGSFRLCAQMHELPENDEPAGAIELVANSYKKWITGSIEYSTATQEIGGEPCCGYYTGRDVWYYFVANPNYIYRLESRAGSLIDATIEVYAGRRNELRRITCKDDGLKGNLMPVVENLSGYADTIWIRVFPYGGEIVGNFELSLVSSPAREGQKVLLDQTHPKVFPNPISNGWIALENIQGWEKGEVIIRDKKGNIIYNGVVGGNNYLEFIDIKTPPRPGKYELEITRGEKVYREMIVFK